METNVESVTAEIIVVCPHCTANFPRFAKDYKVIHVAGTNIDRLCPVCWTYLVPKV